MWPNPQKTENLVTFTEEIPSRKLQFCTVRLKELKAQPQVPFHIYLCASKPDWTFHHIRNKFDQYHVLHKAKLQYPGI